MIIQGTPEILRGPRGLNGFGDFGSPQSEGFYASPEWLNAVSSDIFYDSNKSYTSPYFGVMEGGNLGPLLDAAYVAFKARTRTSAESQAADEFQIRARVAVQALYKQVLDREGDTEGLNYFAERFGDVIDPDELQIFKDMAQAEIDARIKEIDAVDKEVSETVVNTTGGGINPVLILAAAAAFLIGG